VKAQEPFEATLTRYRGLLFSVCRRYSSRGAPVEDLLQEVSIALWQQREKLQSITVMPQQAAWVWRVALSTCIDILRRTPELESLDDNYDTIDDRNSNIDTLHEQIALLGEPDQTIASLHLQGYNYEEIGQQVGLTANNISVKLVRIKERLRKQWNAQ